MTNEEVAARNAELVAALKAEHASIKRKRDASEQMLRALKAVYYDQQSGSLLTQTQSSVELAITKAEEGE